MKRFIDKLPLTLRQWLWFIGLWCAGFLAVSLMAYVVRLMMGIA